MSATHTRTRSRSISFSLRLTAISPVGTPERSLDFLPTEVILDIIDLATHASSPKHAKPSGSPTMRSLPAYFYSDADSDQSDDDEGDGTRSGNPATRAYHRDTHTLLALSRSSRFLAELAFTVLYRTVKLSDPLSAELFARTVLASCIAIAGKDVYRLILDADLDAESNIRASKAFTGAAGHWRFQVANGAPNAAAQRKAENDRTRMLTASGRILGLVETGSLTSVLPTSLSSPSSSVFASLRTLVVHSSLLDPFISAPAPFDRSLSPTPSEIILDTYLPAASSYSHRSGKQQSNVAAAVKSSADKSHGDKDSALSRLSAHTTHLSILSPPSIWRLPNETLSAFGGLPNLSHLAVVRRANANEENDKEFVNDLDRILMERGTDSLRCLVVGVLPDPGWDTRSKTGNDQEKQKDATTKERDLEKYLSRSGVWTRLAALAHNYTTTASHLTPALSRARLCIVPARMDAWARASSANSGLWASKFVWWGDGARSAPGEDFWTWANAYEVSRRTREMERELHERMLAALQLGTQ